MSYLRQLNEYAVVIMDYIVDFVPLIVASIIAFACFCLVALVVVLLCSLIKKRRKEERNENTIREIQ